MYNKIKKCFRVVILIAVICSKSSYVTAQQRSLRIIGTVENNMNPVAGAKVILYKDGNSVDIIYTKTNGEFLFDLEINHEYLIEVQKAGMLSKKIAFNTELPDEVMGKWTMEFAMSLFEGCEGVNTSALDDPVDRIKYSTNKSDFISDNAYVQKIRGRIENLLLDIEKCNSDKFQDLVQEADVLNRSKEFEKAREKYEEALKIFPDDRYAQRQIDDINKQIGAHRENQQTYNTSISEADRLFAEKQYESAREKYNEALQAMPQNNYPREKVAEIDRLIQQKSQAEQAQIEAERKYNGLIAQGNAAYVAKNFAEAKSYYEQALLVNPGSSFAQQRIAELGPAIEKQKQQALSREASDKAYKESLVMGQSALQSKDYELARQHFNNAVTLKPDESYPQQMLKEIDRLIADQKMAQLKVEQASVQKQIEAALDEGDRMYKAKNYEAAANAYQKAMQLDPGDSYAEQRYSKLKSMMAVADAEKQQALEKAHREKISEADALVAAASYQQAIAVYQQALLAKPNDAVLQSKLADAEQKLAAQEQKKADNLSRKKEYDQLLTQGDNYFSSQQYANAKETYEKALAMFPGQAYPQSKIQEINNILARDQKEAQYKGTIARADDLLASKDYAQAKTLYQQALAIKAEDVYAKQKIAEIDARIRENERLAAEESAKEVQYERTIREADNLLSLARLPEAKAAYQRALTLKGDEIYPKQKINEIDSRISEQQRLENEKQAKEQQYRDLISRADELFAVKNYEEAKNTYRQALAINTTEGYARQKIAEIDDILNRQQKLATEQRALDQRYNQAILQADNLLKSSKYSEAKNTYQQALGMKPDEAYPKTQIAKIDAQVADQNRLEEEQKAKEFRYNEAVARGDQLYGQNKMEDAKVQYERALSFKPDETYPTGQIAKINGQLAQIEKTKQERAAFEQRYNSVIASADKAYDNREYESAKAGYMQALNMKPSESYPQQRLNKIAEFERIIAQKEAAQQAAAASASATAATMEKPSKLAELNFANDSERDKYLNELKKEYPQGVTLEVHKEKIKTTERFVVYRGDEIREFRKVKFNWGGVEYSLNGKPITQQYFETQVQVREGEYYKEIKL
ncbi:MAG: hypothetical protein JXB24_00090 [Bacteroidales bacterium]|nr:hypothetical protein [Bacteroidales bacterium]